MRLLSRRTVGPLLGLLSQQQPLLVTSFCPNYYYYSTTSSTNSTTTRLGMSSNSSDNNKANSNKPPVICQYIFLRRDLDWPAGAMAAQAAHASVAAITQALAAQDQATATYVSPEHLPQMTKMVYGVDNQEQLETVRDAWNTLMRSLIIEQQEDDKSVPHDSCLHAYWWVEQPENIPTALATWPVIRTNKVSKAIKNLNLSYF